MDKHTICLLNDSFPPIIDGVANAVVNYAENIEKHHGHAVVVTPAVPGADDSGFPFPVVRYPSIDTRRLVGYVAGYPFSPETALRVREKEVRAEVETLRLSDRCFFTGSIADRETLRAWYSRADLFLFPSTFDTNGLVVREAAASGCPSVLIAGSCAAEGVTDGRNGFLIEENAVSLCAKLTALCADREAMRRVGENAMRELYLSWEDAVARANERYAVVLDRYRSGKYPKHKRFSDEFFNTQGDLMEAMSRVAEMRGETGRLRRELREGFDEAREALREKLEKEW